MGFASLYPSYGCPQGVIPASAGMTIRGEPSSGPAAARPGRITPGGSRPCGSGHGRSHTRYGSGAKVPDRKSTRLNLQSLMRISYAVFCLKTKNNSNTHKRHDPTHHTASTHYTTAKYDHHINHVPQTPISTHL